MNYRREWCGVHVHVLICEACGHLLSEHRGSHENGWQCGCGCLYFEGMNTYPVHDVSEFRTCNLDHFEAWRPGATSQGSGTSVPDPASVHNSERGS